MNSFWANFFFSQENGSYRKDVLDGMGTRYPWAPRQHMALQTMLHMQGRAKDQGKPGTPHVLALWDAVGITHEINGYRNEAAGWIQHYSDERALQLDAHAYYDVLEQMVRSKPLSEVNRQIDANQRNVARVDGMRRAAIVLHYFNNPQVDGPVLTRLDDLRDTGMIDEAEYQARRIALVRSAVPTARQTVAHSELGVLDAERRKGQAARAPVEDQMRKHAGEMMGDWGKYRQRIDGALYKSFKEHWSEFKKHACELVDKRTPALVAWLEAPLLLDALNDYHHANVEDGLLFEQDIGEAIVGLGASPRGKEKIAQWVGELKATSEPNLLWRAVALNQRQACEELDAALAEAAQYHASQKLARTLDMANYVNKSLKALADIYKKAQGVYDANLKANALEGNSAFGARLRPMKMGGADKFAISVGDAVFRHFRIDRIADFASEKIIQHIFSVRAFVSPADSANLIVAQSKKEMGDEFNRARVLQRLRTARAFMAADAPAMKAAQGEALAQEWKNFKAQGGDAPARAIKDARLALVVGLIEGMNFSKLLAECAIKDDDKALAKARWSLLASGMSIVSALFDVSATVAKNLPSMGSNSWSYQGLKLWGGLLSGGASFIGGWWDFEDAVKQSDKGYDLTAYFYLGKGILGIAGGVFTLAVTFTYSGPLILRLAGSVGLRATANTLGRAALWLVGLRIIGMGLGWWITVSSFAVQIVIWIIEPDALQKWIDHSAFGKLRTKEGYKTVKEQTDELAAVMVAMELV